MATSTAGNSRQVHYMVICMYDCIRIGILYSRYKIPDVRYLFVPRDWYLIFKAGTLHGCNANPKTPNPIDANPKFPSPIDGCNANPKTPNPRPKLQIKRNLKNLNSNRQNTFTRNPPPSTLTLTPHPSPGRPHGEAHRRRAHQGRPDEL